MSSDFFIPVKATPTMLAVAPPHKLHKTMRLNTFSALLAQDLLVALAHLLETLCRGEKLNVRQHDDAL